MWLRKSVGRVINLFLHLYVLIISTYGYGIIKVQADRRTLKKEETNMNGFKNAADVAPEPTYVILGASGNTGSIIADFLLSKGRKVRVVGRDAARLQRFVRKGAEAFTSDVSDAAALTKAFSGARAAYLMLPPITSRENQERESDAITQAVTESGLRYAVHLSSYGAQVPEGTGPVTGLHSSEQKLNAISGLNVLHLRAAYFMENNLSAIGMIQGMGIFGHAFLPDLKLPMAATRDVGDYAARRFSALDFSGKHTRELLGERDLSMTEATAVIARGIGKPDLRYVQFTYDQVQQTLEKMGMTPKKAAVYIEMFEAINTGVLVPQEPRSRENTTPTSFETFVQEVFAPAYHGTAATA
jgi:uncharacterized protein YbjT (DUF2867 family)